MVSGFGACGGAKNNRGDERRAEVREDERVTRHPTLLTTTAPAARMCETFERNNNANNKKRATTTYDCDVITVITNMRNWCN